jgi:hypothetical protein
VNEMSLDEPTGGQMDLQLAAAAFLADNKDTRMLLRVLGQSLQETLGGRVEVTRSSGGLLHRSSPEVKAITVHLDPDDYQVELDGDRVRCTVARSSGGIRIRSEQLPVQQWLERLLGALQAEAESNQSAQAALQRVVLGGGS